MMRKRKPHSKKTRRKMSEAAKNSPKAKAARKALHKNRKAIEKARRTNTGQKRTSEQCQRMSRAQKGHKVSEEARKNMSKAHHKEQRVNFTPEVRRKISQALKGRPLSKEHKEKLSRIRTEKIIAGKISGDAFGIQGDFYSKKNKQTLHYRSLLERDWYRLLEAMTKVHRYYVEPVIIEYKWKETAHHYIPDLRIRYTDGTTELMEIKPEGKFFRDDPRNKTKWAAAKRWCEGRKVPTTFKVVGYEELN